MQTVNMCYIGINKFLFTVKKQEGYVMYGICVSKMRVYTFMVYKQLAVRGPHILAVYYMSIAVKLNCRAPNSRPSERKGHCILHLSTRD